MKQGRDPFKTIQRKAPVAPPAYRPMPVPKVLQRKTAIAGPNVNKHCQPAPANPLQRTIPFVLQRKEITRPQTPPVPVKQPVRPGISRPTILQPKVIQRASGGWKMGQSEAEMSNEQWSKSGMATYASMMVDDDEDELKELGLTKSLKTKTHGAEHAEDVAMRGLVDEYGEDGLEGRSVILNLSKSPCSSKFGTSGDKNPGCAENLVGFAKHYKVNITLICRGLYKGAPGSQLAIDWMRTKGITVSVDERVGREKRFGEKKDEDEE